MPGTHHSATLAPGPGAVPQSALQTLVELLNRLADARTMLDVNIAAGIALEGVRLFVS